MTQALRYFPDPILREKAQRISNFKDVSLHSLIETMMKVMRSQPHGIGLAAPQIGIPKQVAIVDVSSRDPEAGTLILINPEILEVGGQVIRREGCMSLPDYTAYLKRFHSVRMRWQDLSGEYKEKMTAGVEAVCIQHEVDHLNGVLFLDRVVSLKTDMLPRQSNKQSKFKFQSNKQSKFKF